MGLDTSLYKEKIKPKIEQVFDKLIEADTEMEEVLYWRKNYNLLDWFNEELGEIENCKYYEVTEETFIKWLNDLETLELKYDNGHLEETEDRDIEMITKILKETDFKTTKFYFYNWW